MIILEEKDTEKKRINPNQRAVAIRYDPSEVAPKVVAKGSGYVADKILEMGKENNVAVYSDSNLVDELTKVNIGDSIPPELYEVVAQVLIFISDLDKLEAYKKRGQ